MPEQVFGWLVALTTVGLIVSVLFLAVLLALDWWQGRQARKRNQQIFQSSVRAMRESIAEIREARKCESKQRTAEVWKEALEALQEPPEAKNKSLEQTCRDLLRIAVDDDLVDEGCTEPENLAAGELFSPLSEKQKQVIYDMQDKYVP